MGSFFTDLLSFDHEVAVYDNDPQRLRFLYNTQRFISLNEVDAFDPECIKQIFETIHEESVKQQMEVLNK